MRYITAFFMAWGNFLVIPCPCKLWDSRLNRLMLAFLPEIGALIDRMRKLGAGAAFMTGSGSTVVGAFSDPAAARAAAQALPRAVLTRTLPALPNGNLS